MYGLKKYEIKPKKYYEELKKKYKDTVLNFYYQTAFEQSDVIGKCIYSLKKWCNETTDYSLESFFDYYFIHVTSLICFERLASSLCHLCYNDGLIVSKEDCLDILICHAIIETYDGGSVEKFVAYYIKNQEDTSLLPENDKWDRKYGIDNGFVYHERIYLIQIKPFTFFIGKNSETIKDRKEAFVKINNFKKDCEEYKDAIVRYIIYEKREDGIYFLKNKDSIFVTINEKYFNEDVDAFRHDFCDNKELWKKMIDFN